MKLLIIDDQAKMVELIQLQFSKLNESFSKQNTYFFQIENQTKLDVQSFSKVNVLNDCSFSGFSKYDVLEKVDELINDAISSSEWIFIVIDMCLKKDILGNYDITDYFAYEEFCADIYRHLIETKNQSSKYEKLIFAIYSRSETFVSVISKVLKDQYIMERKKLKLDINKDIKGFPYASCEAHNISWFTNIWRPTDCDCKEKVCDNYPLNLPKELCDFLRELSD